MNLNLITSVIFNFRYRIYKHLVSSNLELDIPLCVLFSMFISEIEVKIKSIINIITLLLNAQFYPEGLKAYTRNIYKQRTYPLAYSRPPNHKSWIRPCECRSICSHFICTLLLCLCLFDLCTLFVYIHFES
jgi:hypothetical protein